MLGALQAAVDCLSSMTAKSQLLAFASHANALPLPEGIPLSSFAWRSLSPCARRRCVLKASMIWQGW